MAEVAGARRAVQVAARSAAPVGFCDVLDGVTTAVVVLDLKGTVLYLNHAGATLTAHDPEAAKGRSIVELFPSLGDAAQARPDEERACQHLSDLLERATGAATEELLIEHPRPSGEPRSALWTARLIADADGTGSLIVATGRDVTDGMADQALLVESGRRYLGLLDAASDLVVCLDAEGIVVHASAGARPLLGYDPEEMIGIHAFDLVHPHDLAEALENFTATADGSADDSPMTLRARSASGTWVPFEVYGRNQLDNPDIAALVVSMRDITERDRHNAELKESQEALRLAERQFRSSFDNAPIGMALVSIDGAFLRVNQALGQILGRDEASLLATRFQALTHPDDLDLDLELLDDLLTGERLSYEMEKRYVRPDGTSVWTQLNVTLVRDGIGRPMHFVSQIQDISERRALHAELVAQASLDSLTGLANRARFEEHLASACEAVEDHGSVTVLFLDLNEFKEINDTYGHAGGDLVLQRTADRIRSAVRPEDLAARLGGDEMAVVLAGASPATVDRVTERLRRVIAEPIELESTAIAVGVSIGAVTTTEAMSASALLDQADVAMYVDKRSST